MLSIINRLGKISARYWSVGLFLCALSLLIFRTIPIILSSTLFTDFAVYYFAATGLTQGISPYDLANVNALAEGIVPYWEGIGPFLYPPFSLLLFVPFTLVSFVSAKITWALIHIGILVLCGGFYYFLVKPKTVFEWHLYWILMSAFVFFYPTERVIQYGQLELVILALLLGFLVAIKKSRPVLAGILLGVGGILKLYPLFFLVVCAIKKQWTVVISSIVTVGVLFIAGMVIFSSDISKEYVTDIFPSLLQGEASREAITKGEQHAGSVYWPGNSSFAGFFHKTLTMQAVTTGFIDNTALADTLTKICSLLIILVSLIVLWWKRAVVNTELVLSLWILVFLLINPLTWDHYLVLTTLPVFFLTFHIVRNQKTLLWLLPLYLSFAIVRLRIYYWEDFLRHGAGTILMSIKTIGIFCLWIIVLLYIIALSKKLTGDGVGGLLRRARLRAPRETEAGRTR